jgi:hypothetical protein
MLVLSLIIGLLKAHMVLSDPKPRTGTLNEPATTVCQGKPLGESVASVAAGSNIPITIAGSASHGGGSCQFSLACSKELSDPTNPKFKTIYITDKNCPLDTFNKYTVPIPSNASGKCVLSWTWIPILAGQAEMYQNCVDITVTGGSGSALNGPDIVYFNTLNKAGPQLHGDNAQNAPTLFEKYFGLQKIASFQESVAIAKDKNFGISSSSGPPPTTSGSSDTISIPHRPTIGTSSGIMSTPLGFFLSIIILQI